MGYGNRVSIKYRQYYGFFHPIMTMEYKAFGYRKGENDIDEIDDGYLTTIKEDWPGHYSSKTEEQSHIVKYARFKRHVEYVTNPLFWILEFFMQVVSFIRVYLGKFIILACGILYILGWIHNDLYRFLLYTIITIYVASFAIPILGFITRMVFKLDAATDEICEENGWKKWSEYEDD